MLSKIVAVKKPKPKVNVAQIPDLSKIIKDQQK